MIYKIRQWTIKTGLSSETSFELLCKLSNKILEKRLSRPDFHKAIGMVNELKPMTAVEIDALFHLLDSKSDGELDLEEWRSRIYEDTNNPLQMLREIV